eukprot:gene28788-34753_t
MGQLYSRSVDDERIQFLLNHGIPASEVLQFVDDDYYRLDSLVRFNSDVCKNRNRSVLPSFDGTFEHFVECNPKWRKIDSIVLFWRYYEAGDAKIIEGEGKNFKLLLRQRSGGLCFMHAPVVLQHYMVSIGCGKAADILDIIRYIDEHWKGRVMLNYLRGKGESSLDFLRAIFKECVQMTSYLITDRNYDAEYHVWVCERVMEILHTRPALVSQFSVYRKFHDAPSTHQSSFSSVGKEEDCIGSHSMVLVGMRYDKEEDQYYFLLQNWWENSYFVEVTGDYMCAVGGVISFVLSDTEEIPDNLPRLSTDSAQDVFDVQEWIVEMSCSY